MFLALASGTYASAQDAPSLSCKDLRITIAEVPDTVPLSFTVPADDLMKQCAASDGAQFTLIALASGVTVSPEPGTTQTYTFTVRDTNGNEASAQLVIART